MRLRAPQLEKTRPFSKWIVAEPPEDRPSGAFRFAASLSSVSSPRPARRVGLVIDERLSGAVLDNNNFTAAATEAFGRHLFIDSQATLSW
jgi:hypothetical protein